MVVLDGPGDDAAERGTGDTDGSDRVGEEASEGLRSDATSSLVEYATALCADVTDGLRPAEEGDDLGSTDSVWP